MLCSVANPTTTRTGFCAVVVEGDVPLGWGLPVVVVVGVELVALEDAPTVVPEVELAGAMEPPP
jgi:hypothetical protein